MSNRTLVIIIVIIILAATAGVLWYRSANQAVLSGEANAPQQNVSPTPGGSISLGDKSAASSAPAEAASSSASTAPAAVSGDCKTDFDPNKLKTAKVDIANKFVTLNVKNYGSIKIQLYDKDAPKTVENFLRLVNSGFYDCLTFHRIAKGFVIQGGDPKGDGTGGITASGQPLIDELDSSAPSYIAGYTKGVLAMAKTPAPNSATSQFFIMLADHPELPHDYPIFGKVISGLDVVDKIGQAEIIPNPQMGANDGAPKTPIIITKATITSK